MIPDLPTLTEDDPIAVANPRQRRASAVEDPAPQLSLPVDPALLREAETVRTKLAAAHPNASADELLLIELVTDELPVLRMLHDAERQLATRVPLLLNDPRLACATLAVLKDVRASINAVATRMANGLAATASLRAQRHLLRFQGSRDD